MGAKFRLTTLLISLIFLTACSGCAMVQREVCENMEDPDHCYQDLAVRWDSPDDCQKIERAGPQTKCIIRIVKKTGDLDLCDQMKTGVGAYSKEQCMMDGAIVKLNPSICNEISDTYTHMGNDLSDGKISKEACLDKVYSKCGKEHGSCCSDFTCDVSMYCDVANGKCIQFDEGGQGEPCYSPKGSDRLVCAHYLKCSQEGICTDNECGGLGQPCCNEKAYKQCDYSATCLNGKCA